MSRIQSNFGLITGIPITDTVDQLISISAQPRDRLSARLSDFQQQQVALNDLTASVIAVQLAGQKLGSASVFSSKSVTSSDSTLLSVVSSGTPLEGSYQFTPVRQASAQQFLSSGFSSVDEPIGAGVFTLRNGGFVDRGAQLSELNNGLGVQRGQIKITDRAGDSAIVDLRYARTIDDIVNAINASDEVSVQAQISGDAIQLTDNTSGAGNLRVDEVGLGNTAADLGLAGINTSASQATGSNLVSLFDDALLESLNDGNGIQFNKELDDLRVTLADGTTLDVDFGDFSSDAGQASGTTNAVNGVDSQLTFTAVQSGAQYDDVRIRFVDDAGVTQGGETVAYDDSDPDNKTLTFNIDAGATTADDIVAALAADPTASGLFTAASDGNGTGVVSTSDVATTSGGAAVAARTKPTVDDLLRKLNEADPGKLEARISNDGLRIELEDKTSGANTFEVTSLFGGSTAEGLGLTGTANGGVVTGDRIVSGLKSVLLRNLNGGGGFGALGAISLTDRAGASDTVDLSSAVTLDDVIDQINSSSTQITASINSARNGIQLEDASGGSGALIIANGDATNAADLLQVAANDFVSAVDSGSLDLQVFNEGTQLASLNGGAGVDLGSFTITDTNGQTAAVNLTVSEAATVGDVIEEINGLGIGVEARINDSGDGLLLVDTVGGSGSITVTDSGVGTSAADLQIAGVSSSITINGAPTEVIDGSTTVRIEIDSDDTLQDLVDALNESGASVSASIINEGSGSKPFRLSLTSETTGSLGELLVDTSSAGFDLQEIAKAQDALLLLGSPSAAGGVLASSSTNTFDSVLEGVTLTIEGASTSPVNVAVDASDEELLRDAQLFADTFNTLIDKLDQYTFFSEVDQSTGVLFGTSEALRVESVVSSIVTDRHFGLGKFQTLAELGFSVDDEGKLSLDEKQLQEQFEIAPEDVERFFTSETTGFANKLNDVLERLAGADNSVLLNRTSSLQAKIDSGNERIAFLNLRLDAERESLLKTFYNMETAIAKMQANLSSINAISALPPLTANSSN